MSDTDLPILYSFRRCPYAIRARMALIACNIEIEHREILLKNKPPSMLTASPKGTVPVLVLKDGTVIDESLDMMFWALQQKDPMNWLGEGQKYLQPSLSLVNINDREFKPCLDRYKYSDRYPKKSQTFYRSQCECFLQKLNDLLSKHTYLIDNQISIADIAIMPFIRQCAFVDSDWFDQSPYPKLRFWLNEFIESALFNTVMTKYPQWASE